ncbi:MAG: hypothetical protein WC516_06090 [Patescibacteria group bacterium]|jgi:hypothetical protein
MAKGRKPSQELKEAREVVLSGQLEVVLADLQASENAKVRILKAVKFGLGIKEAETPIEEVKIRKENYGY